MRSASAHATARWWISSTFYTPGVGVWRAVRFHATGYNFGQAEAAKRDTLASTAVRVNDQLNGVLALSTSFNWSCWRWWASSAAPWMPNATYCSPFAARNDIHILRRSVP